VLALAQATTAPVVPDKPKQIQPFVASEHTGNGRIGVRLNFDKDTGLPVIAGITKGGPAADFGLQVGDVILKIGKNSVFSMTEDEIRLSLHGEPGTGVELTIQRGDDPDYIVRAIERRLLPADAEETTVITALEVKP
jgi:C-terminal processing protease CtpA/Prc